MAPNSDGRITIFAPEGRNDTSPLPVTYRHSDMTRISSPLWVLNIDSDTFRTVTAAAVRPVEKNRGTTLERH